MEVKFYHKNGGERAYDADNFVYRLRSSVKGGKKYFNCVKGPVCPAKIVLSGAVIISTKHEHNHGPMQSMLEVEKLEAEKLEQALLNTNTSSSRSLASSVASSVDSTNLLLFSPPSQVQKYWKKGIKVFAMEHISHPGKEEGSWDVVKDSIILFLSYVRDTWVGTKEKSPMFPVNMWSMWRSMMDMEIPTATGGSEAYNLQLARVIANGAIWKVIDAIRNEDALSTKKVADLAANRPLVAEHVHKKRIEARKKMLENIKDIVTAGDGSRIDILKGIVAVMEKSVAL